MIRFRPTVMQVDLDAITHNVRALRAAAATRHFCAVVKADGYGHGSVEAARAAQAGGATWLAVALVEEGVHLRQAGLDGPILVLSEPPPGAFDAVVQHGLVPTVYSAGAIAEAADAARRHGVVCEVHLKVDTGMHRVGAQPVEVVALAGRIDLDASLHLGGVWTHLAVADAPDDPYTAHQLGLLDATLTALAVAGIDHGMVHAANSAGTLAHPAARRDMVRCGIAIYGQDPDLALPAGRYGVTLRPALRLSSRVSHVKVLPAGERVSYGLAYRLEVPSVVATVPVGYADGVPRRLSAVGGAVLIGGRRRTMAGRVTMDQILVDCGPVDGAGAAEAGGVARGDEVVLLGSQGHETVTAWEWAQRLDTIAYEITCGMSRRPPRSYVGGHA
jgi:alanine racemase